MVAVKELQNNGPKLDFTKCATLQSLSKSRQCYLPVWR